MIGRLYRTSVTTPGTPGFGFDCMDGMQFVSYWRNVQKGENYHDVVLKNIYPFVYVIEPAAQVFVFRQCRQ